MPTKRTQTHNPLIMCMLFRNYECPVTYGSHVAWNILSILRLFLFYLPLSLTLATDLSVRANDSSISAPAVRSTRSSSSSSSSYSLAAQSSNLSYSARNRTGLGHWLNKGIDYPNCPEPYETDLCSESSMNEKVVDRTKTWRPDYASVIQRISCALRKINCPADERSFQMHDIPCQSSCLIVLAMCGKITTPGLVRPELSASTSAALGCRTDNLQISESNFWPYNGGGDYEGAFMQPQQTYTYPYKSNLMSQRYSRLYGHLLSRDSIGQQQQYGALSYSSPNPKTFRSRSTSFYPWGQRRQRSSFRTDSGISNIPEDNISPNQISEYRNSYQKPGKNSAMTDRLSEADCFFLPAGGCDKLSGVLNAAHQFTSSNLEANVRVNPGCPDDLRTKCAAMFPHDFTRNQWVKGRFTVAIVIRVAQTLWWFGKGDRYQPFFRFHVLETLESDIHPYDDKMILTYSWPERCICPEEITVDKKYLMLTHSFKSRQTLNISSSTVFLSRVKRYTKRLSCWRGACIRRRGPNRRRRYPPAGWKWKP
ncbi:unnamed protein product [Calicophoron daubneyi]|uniref:Uncharacterized protein n=1 Tax=Calicophoron daubneyi TaxID=300641 RepID=A0AAV2TJV1_CALDB